MEAVLKEYNSKQDKKSSERTLNQPEHLRTGSCLAEEASGDNKNSEVILPLEEEVIKRHRLTIDEIREIPRFKDYDAGSPTQVHMVKLWSEDRISRKACYA